VLNFICPNPFYGSLELDYRKCIQRHIVDTADGNLLQFNDLIAKLESAGYDTHAWYYDFRRSVKDLADDLYKTVMQVSADGQPAYPTTSSSFTPRT
jgi:hypothetical protein